MARSSRSTRAASNSALDPKRRMEMMVMVMLSYFGDVRLLAHGRRIHAVRAFRGSQFSNPACDCNSGEALLRPVHGCAVDGQDEIAGLLSCLLSRAAHVE